MCEHVSHNATAAPMILTTCTKSNPRPPCQYVSHNATAAPMVIRAYTESDP